MTTYGLIGYPLGHSFSSKFFTEKFAAEQIHAEYLNFPISTDKPLGSELKALLDTHPGLRGLNVTIPYKQAVIPLLECISPSAAEVGAVNTILIERTPEGHTRLKGYNTDTYGFRNSLLPLLPLLPSRNHSALILGSGGASLAVAHVLSSLSIPFTIVSRTPGDSRITYADLTPSMMAANDIIVNATPLGTFPNTESCPPIPYGELSPAHLCYDLVYNPPLTQFLSLARAQGALTANGSEMLRLQALKAWQIWNESTM